MHIQKKGRAAHSTNLPSIQTELQPTIELSKGHTDPCVMLLMSHHMAALWKMPLYQAGQNRSEAHPPAVFLLTLLRHGPCFQLGRKRDCDCGTASHAPRGNAGTLAGEHSAPKRIMLCQRPLASNTIHIISFSSRDKSMAPCPIRTKMKLLLEAK